MRDETLLRRGGGCAAAAEENPLNLRLVCSNPFETDVEEMIDFVRTSQEVNLRKARLSELSSPAPHRSAAVR